MVSVSRRRDGDVLTLAVSGEVDLATSPLVDEAITEAVASSGISAVEVDLSGVGFLDSSCIALLLKGRRSADAQGVAYRVTGAQGIPLDVLQITGVWEHLSGDTGSTSEPTLS
jgi:anti-sigma B factor antagonist